MKHLVIIILGLLSCSVFSQNTEWLVSSSAVKFKIKNAGFTVDGTFSGLSAKISFDGKKNYGNSIEAIISSGTVNTGNSTRDGHLRKKEYFDTETFMSIVMKATLFGKDKDGSFKGFFKLTIKDKTKDVMVPFTFTEKDGKGVFKATFTINRLDFGVGESSIMLSDNVLVNIEVNVITK